jgi:predicted MFS family arabinose efflux permease
MPGPRPIARQLRFGHPAGLPPLARSLLRLHAYAFCTYPFAAAPFLFLWFARHGIDEGQYGELLSAYYVAMFVAEVPTGMLADRCGRRLMLLLGPLLLAAGFALLLVWPTYEGFLTGEVLLGVGHAVLSGPPGALLFEVLRQHDQHHRFLEIEARLSALRLLGTGTAFLLGGALVRFGNDSGDAYGAAIIATCVGNLVATLLASGLPRDPPRPSLPFHEFAHGVAAELRKPAVAWLLAYWLVLFALLRFPFHNYQPWLSAAGEQVPLLHDPLFVGVLFAALNLGAAPLSAMVPALVARWGRRPLFVGMPLVLCASFFVMAGERAAAAAGHGSAPLVWLGLSMFFVQQVPFGMHWSLLQEFVNHRIASATRTTVLSALSLGARAAYAGVNVLLFHLQAATSIATAFAVAGLGGLLATLLVLRRRPLGLLRGQGPLAD